MGSALGASYGRLLLFGTSHARNVCLSVASPRLQPPLPSPLLPGLGQPCTPWLPGSIPTTPLRAASRQLRYHAEGSFNLQNLPGQRPRRRPWKPRDRPRNQVNCSRAQPLLPHTQATKGDVSLMSMVLVGVSLLDTKQMRSRQLASFCWLHKSGQKHMS